MSITENIQVRLDDNEFVGGVFEDLKKAFDMVDLIGKLHYGVTGIAMDWFCSYLANKKQFVLVNNHISAIQQSWQQFLKSTFLFSLFLSMTFTTAQNIPELIILQMTQTSFILINLYRTWEIK